MRLGTVASIYNPSYLEAEIWRMVFQGQPGKKVTETPISFSKVGCGSMQET
jgi:hypothetical protein